MQNDQKKQETDQPSGVGEQNETLQKEGTAVADYGNVMGGSSDENVPQTDNGAQQTNSNRSGEGKQTMGNP